VFLAGADRSGTTLLYAILASHPRISMQRRTNMWRYFDGRYGDLKDDANLDRCLRDMRGYRRLRGLEPDIERIRREFVAGDRTYGRLFALFHEHQAERLGRPRWGDKSLHTEHHAARILAEHPDARVLHIVRDPRDRYASVRRRHGRDVSQLASATGRWLASTRTGLRNVRRFPSRYRLIRYEDLVRDPERTVRGVCDFIGEAFDPRLLSMEGAPEHRDAGGNGSFGDVAPGTISTAGVGRFRRVLEPEEIAFIQLATARTLAALRYGRASVSMPPPRRAWFTCWYLPINLARVVAWRSVARFRRRRGLPVPGSRRGADDR
jgi:hypothetical protein